LLPGGYIFRVCTKVDTFPDGEMFVGVGIAPDIDVPLRIQDVIEGRDAALNKAVEVLQK
jgi:C-terminal processing protease CtpA/Prc